jgi:hypothetical protein
MESGSSDQQDYEQKTCGHRCPECRDSWDHSWAGRCRLKSLATCQECLRGIAYEYSKAVPTSVCSLEDLEIK